MRTAPFVLLLLVAAPAAKAQPQVAASSAQPPPAEAAPAVDDIVVVTASRREEQLLNAPATMTVITEEAIATSPDQSVPALLRLVPGLNVVQTSARDVNVTTRAATGTLSDSMLVLLDGRSVYQDLFGFVLWDFLPIDSTEIKQIEVIRGPASAVWGANAMSGVVNVISKAPREMQGTSVGILFGQFDRSPPRGPFDGGGLFSLSVNHATAITDRFAYKLSAGVTTSEALLRPLGNLTGTGTPYPPFENRGTTQPKLDARADYDLEDGRRKIVLAGGISGTEGIIHTGLGPLDVRRGSTFKYGRITYTRDKLKVQAFVNALDGEAPALLLRAVTGAPLGFTFENQVYDAELSNLHLWRGRHLVSYGANYRHNNFNLSFAPGRTTRDEGGVYVQDEIFLSDRYRWIVGARADRFDILRKAVFSPRTTFLIKPRASQTVRFSFNRAFRAPSFVNSYLDAAFLAQIDLGSATSYAFPTVAHGNEELKEERLTAYEAGYIGGFGRTTLGAAVYVNRTDNMVQFARASTYTSLSPPPAWPLPLALLDQLNAEGRGLPSRYQYLNFRRVTDHGVEASAEVRMTPTATAFANYSWQGEPQPDGFAVSELNLPPGHRVNAGVRASHGRYFGHLSASIVAAAFWQDVLPGYEGWTDRYTLIDGGVGVHSTDGALRIAVHGRNIFNQPVQQHIFGDVMRRAVTGEVRVQF
jgi:iron complex outermembrane receptor protein